MWQSNISNRKVIQSAGGKCNERRRCKKELVLALAAIKMLAKKRPGNGFPHSRDNKKTVTHQYALPGSSVRQDAQMTNKLSPLCVGLTNGCNKNMKGNKIALPLLY